MLEESLESSIVGLDLGTTWKGGGNLSEIDRFDFEQARDDIGQAFNAREMPIGKVKLEEMSEYGSLSHGVVSCCVGECDTAFFIHPL